jgi:hypothetical protein
MHLGGTLGHLRVAKLARFYEQNKFAIIRGGGGGFQLEAQSEPVVW